MNEIRHLGTAFAVALLSVNDCRLGTEDDYMELSSEAVREFARDRFNEANVATNTIRFSTRTGGTLLAEQYMAKSARALTDRPEFEELDTSFGKLAWAAMLCVDLRGSSQRAIAVGAKSTYLTMHTYLPTMIHVSSHFAGEVVGLRGDGIIVALGLKEVEKPLNNEIEPNHGSEAVRNAVKCGKAMIESIEIVNSILKDADIRAGLEVGVGIDTGEVVVTRIGHLTATELTAYGPCVNKCCKLSNESSKICLTYSARDTYPQGKGGTARFGSSKNDGAVTIEWGWDYRVLSDTVKRKNNPR